MLVIGLTGGIGSGKSAAAKYFSGFGAPIIDADLLARDVVQNNQDVFSEIVEHFGKQILLNDREINRAKLKNIVFNDEQERHWLEKLLHPLIIAEIKTKISQLSAPYCIVVIPLLFEYGPFEFLDRILVIDTELQTQMDRVRLRDNLPDEQIQAILKSQVERKVRLRGAHDIINNDADYLQLQKDVEKIHNLYVSLGNNGAKAKRKEN